MCSRSIIVTHERGLFADQMFDLKLNKIHRGDFQSLLNAYTVHA